MIRTTIFYLFFPITVSGQVNEVVSRLLADSSIIGLDSSLFQATDTNRKNKRNQLHGVWRVRGKEDSRLLYIATYLNGERHGPSIGFFPNEKIATSTYHKFGIEVGPGQEFWQNGHQRSIRHFKDGMVEGIVKLFDTTGQLTRVFEIRDGKKEGDEIVFYPSGNIRIVTRYLKGQEHGIRNLYRDKGNPVLISQCDISMGVLEAERFYENGIVVWTESYK